MGLNHCKASTKPWFFTSRLHLLQNFKKKTSSVNHCNEIHVKSNFGFDIIL